MLPSLQAHNAAEHSQGFIPSSLQSPWQLSPLFLGNSPSTPSSSYHSWQLPHNCLKRLERSILHWDNKPHVSVKGGKKAIAVHAGKLYGNAEDSVGGFVVSLEPDFAMDLQSTSLNVEKAFHSCGKTDAFNGNSNTTYSVRSVIEFPYPTPLSLGAIVALCGAGRFLEAFKVAKRMEEADMCLTPHSLVCLLHTCSTEKNVAALKELLYFAVKSGCDSNALVGTQLIQIFTMIKNLSEATRIFNKIHTPNMFTWTAIISAHAKLGQNEQAITLYNRIQDSGMELDGHVFAVVLSACCSAAELQQGKHIHCCIIERGLEDNIVVGNAIVNMYTKCRSLKDAYVGFERLPRRNVVTWTTLIAGCVEEECCQEAFEVLEKMQEQGTQPNVVTFVHILKACSSIAALQHGKGIHACIIESGLDCDMFIGSSLIDMYSKCSSLQEARMVFDKLPNRNAIIWSAMLAGYAEHDQWCAQEALQLYLEMQFEGIQSDSVTFCIVLKACSNLSDLEQGKQVHHDIIESGLEMDVFISSSIINMYVKCGNLKDAHSVFCKSLERNVVTWSSLIAGYTELGHSQQALQLFQEMQQDGIEPDQAIFLCILEACANMAALEHGKHIHMHIIERGLEMDLHVGSILIHMYSKCGSLTDAVTIFDRLLHRNVVTFNSLISGFAQHNDYFFALKCFENMQMAGCQPDNVTYLLLFSACGKFRLLEEGCYMFKLMRDGGQILPGVEHYNAMVYIFGRSGYLSEAEDLLNTIPFQHNYVGWISLLDSCRSYSNMELGKRCFDHVSTAEPSIGSGYVLMSSIYSNAEMDENVKLVEQLRISAHGWKMPGKAFIEIDYKVHIFMVGENTHPQSPEIYAKLRQLNARMREEGYFPPGLIMKDLNESSVENRSCGHCERLAVGFGLISTPQNRTLRVRKNLRVCADCHTVIRIISKIEGRNIILIDAFCVHDFQDGVCTCQNYSFNEVDMLRALGRSN